MMKKLVVISVVMVAFLLISARAVSDYYPTIVNIAKEPNKVNKKRPPSRPLERVAKSKNISLPLAEPAIKILKAKRELQLISRGTVVKRYPISLGFTPIGDKKKEGDGKTPEGTFYISQKAKHPDKAYLGTRWMRLSYPSEKHAEIGLRKNLIDDRVRRQIITDLKRLATPPQNTPLGGGIGIHGGTDRIFGGVQLDWTAGCIGLYDSDAEEIYDQVRVGTKVVVKK